MQGDRSNSSGVRMPAKWMHAFGEVLIALPK
jgi:hypothetical protein